MQGSLRTSRSRLLALGVALALAAAPLHAAHAQADAASDASTDAYKLHMKNGVKLYQDRNLVAAIVEFRAAYEAARKPNALVNVALCYKALFDYPNAIAALEAALAAHADAMGDADEKAATDAITEMRALLAYVSITVSPPEAVLTIDGADQPSRATSMPVALGPGTHKIGAHAPGYASAEETITVASGENDKELRLTLVADKGYVSVSADSDKVAIAVDGKPVGYGHWAGLLAPGTHIIQMYEDGGRTDSRQILVVAGKAQEVRPGAGGIAIAAPPPSLPPALPSVPPAPQREPPSPPKRGLFALGTGSLLGPTVHPRGFPDPESNTGAAGGVRFGYRVNSSAAFALMFEYGNVIVSSNADPESDYSLSSTRVGANLRLMTTGRTVRLVGDLGGGIVSTDLAYDVTAALVAACEAGNVSSCDVGRLDACVDGGCSGIDPYLLGEIGLELDFSGVVLGAALQSYFQATKGIDEGPYDNDALVFVGGGLRVGYGAW